MDRFDERTQALLPCECRHTGVGIKRGWHLVGCPGNHWKSVAQALREADAEGAKRARREYGVEKSCINNALRLLGYIADGTLGDVAYSSRGSHERQITRASMQSYAKEAESYLRQAAMTLAAKEEEAP